MRARPGKLRSLRPSGPPSSSSGPSGLSKIVQLRFDSAIHRVERSFRRKREIAEKALPYRRWMPESPLRTLERWELNGALWRTRSLSDTEAVVELLTCH